MHVSEPDCAVRAAFERKEIAASRYETYRAMLSEAQAEDEADLSGPG